MTHESSSALGSTDVYDEAELYAAAFDWLLDSEVNWLLSQCGVVGSVLEPFCGSARYGPVFADRGVRYWGLDRSIAMLRLAPAHRDVQLRQGDAAEFEIDDGPAGGFDLAWCPINSIRHLCDERDVHRHLQCVRRHLKEGRFYVVETDVWQSISEPPQRSLWSMERPDGSTVHATWVRESVDAAQMLCTERATIQLVRDGQIAKALTHVYTMRLWSVGDVMRFAAMSGFEVARVHRSEASANWPRVELSAALDSTEWNYLFFLRAR